MSALNEIKDRLSAAVPGPWSLSLDYQRKWMLLLAGSGTADEYRIAKLADDDTAEFIAHSPADIAKLVAGLEAVLHLHQQSQGHYQNWQGKNMSGAYCETCLDEWPCDTRSSIDEALT